MPTKLERLLEQFQGNAYPAMIDDLAGHLGVSSDSIRRLTPGWAPVVQFKKGPNHQGWWVIPERESDATVIGLSLRSQDDTKVMLPGSKHGLIYEVNPDHGGGEHGYSPGPANWVRTMDAGRLCPVCGKPDGCLLSSENPADPKAVVCIRTKEGASRPLKFGYLHIRKAEGRLKNAAVLADRGGPILIVEGFSDTCAGLDLGFDTVGRPSNLACMDMLADLVRGRACVIVGENDRKADGREPGKEGMIAAFQTLKHVCRDVRMVVPPEHVKDLRAWKVKHGLTREQFLEFIKEHGEQQVPSDVIADDRPTTIARTYLQQCHRLSNRFTLRRWEGTWYRYAGSKYEPLKDEAFTEPLYKWAYGKDVQVETAKGTRLKPLKADNALISNVSQAMTAETLIVSSTLPVWVNGASGPDPKDLVSFANGVLDVQAFLSGESEALFDSTPDLFTTAALPITFDPTAECPAWLAFLDSSLGDESSKIDLLQEWIGYCLTPDTSFQKLMYFRGPPSCGKGTILRVMQALVGRAQVACPTFATLSKDFGTATLVGKLMCLIGDARTPRHGDGSRGLEVLLNISGNDAMDVNRKYKDHLEAQTLFCRVTIASNELLDVPDHAGAMLRRLNFIEFNRSFRDHPDRLLDQKLAAETQGIAVWALSGLRRLRERGFFTVPESAAQSIHEFKLNTSPVASFLDECTEQAPDGEVLKTELFDAWCGWSAERGMFQLQKTKFFERIRSNAVYVTAVTYEKGGHKHNVFRGLKLKPWALRKFMGVR